MAEKQARIRVSLLAGSFLGGLDQIGTRAAAVGSKIGGALNAGTMAGLRSVRTEIGAMTGQLKSGLKMAASLGGALSVGAAIKGAVSLQAEYRNLAQQVNRLSDTGLKWQDIQKTIEATAIKTGQAPKDMVEAFRKIYSATGDLDFTRTALEAIGTASTASGENLQGLAQAAQLASRKFGIGPKEAADAIARIVEKVGVGGAGLEDMNNKFAVMAGEAQTAGLKGTQGLSTLLGIMLQLDSAIGEKASPGLKEMFRILKDNTTQLKAIGKQSGVKFEPDSTAFEKMRKLLGTEKGRVAAELTFTGDARVVYDTLTKPFKEAYEAAKQAGKSTVEATEEGYQAYDAAMARMTSSTMKYSTLQQQAAERMAEDPTVLLKQAMNTFAVEFTKPAMMDAMRKLAAQLPKLAAGLADLVGIVAENPLGAAGVYAGGRLGLSFAAGGLQSMLSGAMAAGAPAAGTAIGGTAATTFVGGLASAGLPIALAAAVTFAVGNALEMADKYAREQKRKRTVEEAGKLQADIELAQGGGEDAVRRLGKERYERYRRGDLTQSERDLLTRGEAGRGETGAAARRAGLITGRSDAEWVQVAQEREASRSEARGRVRAMMGGQAVPGESAPAFLVMGEGGQLMTPGSAAHEVAKIDEAKVGQAAGEGAAAAMGQVTMNVRIVNFPSGAGHGLPPRASNAPGSTPR